MLEPTPLTQVSELRYRLFEGAKDGILILDLGSLKIIDANMPIQKLLGYSKEELLDKQLWEIGLFKDQAESEQLAVELQVSGYIRYEDVPLQAKDGQRHEIEFVSNVCQEGDHAVIRCNIRDISLRQMADEERERRIQTEKLQLLTELARSVAHDLNQSLGLISGYSDLAIVALAEPTLDRVQLRSMLDVLAQAATDGGQIVSRLLTFMRDQPDGPAEDIPLAVLLARVGHLTAPRWRDVAQTEGRAIALSVEAEPDTVIHGWPTRLREALVNLIFNAVDALPEGGDIHLRAYRQGRNIVVEVRDSGTGMSAEIQAQAFRPLFTTKGPYGTGLGLAQVLSTVEQHGGQITIDSSPGQGTTFRLLFPAALPGNAQSTARLAGSLAILVVDDEPALAELAAQILRINGHTVTVMNSGSTALERLSEDAFDVMISDMGMPTMDGWELTRQVRARHPTLPIIIASGWGSQITTEEAHERGIQAVVVKPYRLRDLQKALATLNVSRPAP